MAIAQDGSVYTEKYDGGSNTVAITVADNSNRMLEVEYASYQGGGPSSVTFNGVALTKVVEKVGSFNEVCSIWVLLAPPVGTYNLVVGWGNWSAFGARVLYGVEQELPTNTSTAGGESTTASASITTVSDGSWVAGVIESEAAQTITTVGAMDTWTQEGQSFQHGSGQVVEVSPAASKTVSASLSYSSRWNVALIEITPFVPPTPPSIEVAPRDQNFVPSKMAVWNADTVQGEHLVPIGIQSSGALKITTTESISFTMQPIDPRDENYVNCWCFEGDDGQVYPAVATSDGELLVQYV